MPTRVTTGAKHSASIRQGFVLVGLDPAPPGHAEGADLGPLELLVGEQVEELGLLRVRRRETGLDVVHAQPVEGVDHPAPSRQAERDMPCPCMPSLSVVS